ncbi:MAG: protein translocase subunit SecD [Candidatus Thiodiazotropha lotti]|uniref:Protein translocase subunit SecD n=1 Tax=Candidatus Thiodiazotropha endoloripes TaxID=1818881 RepID=A0A1E2UQT6_9GAMM|nr:protein translocase subunit SecD [Candidatus Thiodiazotropha endoloripes]MCG7897612.1 protein translocase subunit SecD [Candidatus Thiodiazotropha weberae]MCG7989959.1 protein translocase subunit SecD [Candidatus Thiodiazotropha lotti]MCG7903573.1 protein translocase subunit SecD [Candidatus Thiodiazotropha weberae]MCG7914390.1 protein translocase subunit SecD [Candidatus Thiodiazotropha weberae]MCG8001556.1 protein translocase subunit SecD [Candidatus Thiodiazotropha lotti]
MNQYPIWKNLMVLVVVLLGALYALPNLFGQDPSMEISATRDAVVDQTTQSRVEQALQQLGISVKRMEMQQQKLLVRFNSSEDQLKAMDHIAAALGEDYTPALTLAPDLPDWLIGVGAEPMYLGLDLRGGIHVLIDVDMESAITQAAERYSSDIRTLLREEKLRYVRISREDERVVVKFNTAEKRDQAIELIGNEFRNLNVKDIDQEEAFLVEVSLSPAEKQEVQRFALQQNITTLRNRVNALGISEPSIQQQGVRRIVVQLPGAQDPGKVKEILGATATLEYRLADTEHSVEDAVNGRVPPGASLYYERDGRPVLLKKRVIVTGNQIVDASSGLDQQTGSPAVFVSLDGVGAKRMRRMTNENVGRPMAVVFIENRTTTRMVDGKAVKVKRKVEEVISIATIREPFGRRFQTTGLDTTEEARDLALLLRAGALAAPIEIVEERTIGPSLGQDSIDQGFASVMIGLALVMVFMAIYYRVFGLVADMALVMNLVLIVAILSMLQATLTLPGIAGIVLTVGMAVDANVLIFQRIREEIANGNSPQASIQAGYEKAFSTIIDANITTLIAAVVLFSFGTGPIKGFAVTLAIGILTSMFTAIIGTRAVINWIYGRKRVQSLAI